MNDMKKLDVNDIKNIDNAFIIDVRSEEEQKEGMIEGAISMPLDRLENSLDQLPKDKEIYVVCRSGGRSKRACKLLRERGYTTVNLEGGMLNYCE